MKENEKYGNGKFFEVSRKESIGTQKLYGTNIITNRNYMESS
jgi:hypothetical protein